MRDFSICPRCGSPTKPAIAYSGQPSENWLECVKCNTFINTYIPQPHQEAVHADPHTYIGNFGAYGTGKTLTSREEIYKHIFITPNANILIGANVTSQYEQTIKRELENDIPAAFVAGYSAQKSYMDLINGARIMYRPFDDPEKLRSYNLTMFVIVEASEVTGEAFHQLKTRLRNLNAAVQKIDENGEPVFRTLVNGSQVPELEVDWRRGIIESNPDSGWIRTDLLFVSDSVHKHGHVLDDYTIPDTVRDRAISSHVASTDVNAFLPPTFIDELCKNKPTWWVSRFVLSSFSYAEGLVYPIASKCFEPYFEIPKDWKRVIAADYGLSDDFVYLFCAIDEKNGIVHAYKEVRTNNRNIEDLAAIYHKESDDIPAGGLYCPPILDPKSGAKRDYNKKSLFDHFLDYDIYFEPGYINIDARVLRTNTYFESGRLKIMDSCPGLQEELRNYKFPPKKLTGNTRAQDKPEDKNNHGINPLEWVCMALPSDPRKLMYGAYAMGGRRLDIDETEKEDWVPYALRDEDEVFSAPWERMEW